MERDERREKEAKEAKERQELDRENRERDREDRMNMTAALRNSTNPLASHSNLECPQSGLEIQFQSLPNVEGGSQDFPVMVTLSTLEALIR